jgi:hypothetical protein
MDSIRANSLRNICEYASTGVGCRLAITLQGFEAELPQLMASSIDQTWIDLHDNARSSFPGERAVIYSVVSNPEGVVEFLGAWGVSEALWALAAT